MTVGVDCPDADPVLHIHVGRVCLSLDGASGQFNPGKPVQYISLLQHQVNTLYPRQAVQLHPLHPRALVEALPSLASGPTWPTDTLSPSPPSRPGKLLAPVPQINYALANVSILR